MLDRLPSLFGRKRLTVSNAMVSITPTGKVRIERLAPNTDVYNILTAVNDSSPATISEIAEETRLPEAQVKHLVNQLIKAGMLKAEVQQ